MSCLLLLLLLLLLLQYGPAVAVAAEQQNVTFAIAVSRQLPQQQQQQRSNSSSLGSVRATAAASVADLSFASSLRSVSPDYVINLLGCPLPAAAAAAAANATHLLLEASSNCGHDAGGWRPQLVMQNSSWQLTVLQLLQLLRAESVNIEAEHSSRWKDRAVQLLQAVSTDLPSVRVSASASASTADATVIAASDRNRVQRAVTASCNSSTLIVTEAAEAAANCSSSCSISATDAANSNACGDVPELCEFVQLLQSVGCVRPDQSELLLQLMHRIVLLHSSGAGVSRQKVVEELQHSLAERQFVSCRLSAGRSAAGSFGGGKLRFQLPDAAAGRQFVVGILPEPPHLFAGNTTPDGFAVNLSGLSIDMLDLVAKRLNFTYKLKYPPDRKYGGLNPDGSWNGMVGDVIRGETDFAVGSITITAERQLVIDFSEAFMEDGNAILIKRPGQQNPMFRILWPFRLETWVVLAASVPATAFCLFVCGRLSPFSAWNLQLPGRVRDEVTLLENMWALFGSLLQQGQDFYPSSMSGRVILFAWWIFAVLMMAFYTADNIGYLSLDIPESSISSLSELGSQSRVRPLVIAGTNLDTLLQGAPANSDYGRVHAMKSEIRLASDALPLLLKNEPQFAFLHDRGAVAYTAMTNCELMLLPDVFNIASFGWVLPKGAAFKHEFNREIRRLKESGLMAKWISKWWRSEQVCEKLGSKVSQSPIGLQSAGGGFLILGGFCCLGVVALLLETAAKRLAARLPGRSSAYAL